MNLGYAAIKQEPDSNRVLELNKKNTKSVGKNEKNIYLINAKANELFRIVVERRNISLKTKILNPKQTEEYFGDFSELNYLEEIFFLAKETGLYQIQLSSEDYFSPTSEFSLTVSLLVVSDEEKKNYSFAEQITSKIPQVMSTQNLKTQQEFLQELNQALVIWETHNQLNKQADILICMGQIHFFSGEIKKAIDSFSKALSINESVNNVEKQGTLLNNLATSYYKLGDMDKALESYRQIIKLCGITNNQRLKLTVTANIGAVNSLLGNYHEALENLNECLVLARGFLDERSQANITMNIGTTYSYMGEPQKALDSYEKALILATKIGELNIQQVCINGIAQSYTSLGDYQKSFEFYDKAFNLAKSRFDKERQCESLVSLGELHSRLGATEKALICFEQGLVIAREAKSELQQAKSLGSIGRMYAKLQKTDKAINTINESLLIVKRFKSKIFEKIVLEDLGNISCDAGDLNKALEYYESALKLIDSTVPNIAAISILNSMATLYRQLGKTQEATDLYNQSLSVARNVGNKYDVSQILLNLTQIEIKNGLLEEATVHFKECLEIIENNFQTLNSKDLKYSYSSQIQKFYDAGVILYLKKHKLEPKSRYDITALELVERSRTKTFLQLVKESNLDIDLGIDKNLLTQRKTLESLFDSKSSYLLKVLNSSKVSQKEKTLSQKEVDDILQQLDDIEVKIKTQNPQYASLIKFNSLTAREIQTSIGDKDTVLLQYYLRRDKGDLWAISENAIKHFELSSVEEIGELTKKLINLLAGYSNYSNEEKEQLKRKSEYIELASKLGAILLGPVVEEIKSKKLVIVTDGAIQYLPFAALLEPNTDNKPVIVNHEIVHIPSISSALLLRQRIGKASPYSNSMLALGDPIFNLKDVRVSKNDINSPSNGELAVLKDLEEVGIKRDDLLVRLPGTSKEVDEIINLLEKNSSKRLIGFDANLPNLISNIDKFSYIHLATHGVVNSAHPELSTLFTSLYDKDGREQDGCLTLNKILRLKLLNTELVTLSACKTGVGKEIKGEGVIGLSRAFMFAGAKRVLTSSWSISDKGTSELMIRFYKNLFKGKMSPQAALRQAQISMVNDEKWRDPFYWAAFKLEGEWQ